MDYAELEEIIKKKEYEKLTAEHLRTIVRVCQTCTESKTLDNYPKNKSCSYGHHPICKPCFNKKYYTKKREQSQTMIIKPIGQEPIKKEIINQPIMNQETIKAIIN